MSQLAMQFEEWENTYDGFSETFGWTQWVLREAKKVLPEPRPGRLCRLFGHKWGKDISFYPGQVECRGCERCAKRGLVVLQTRG